MEHLAGGRLESRRIAGFTSPRPAIGRRNSSWRVWRTLWPAGRTRRRGEYAHRSVNADSLASAEDIALGHQLLGLIPAASW